MLYTIPPPLSGNDVYEDCFEVFSDNESQHSNSNEMLVGVVIDDAYS